MPCTTILAGRKATYNGSTMISRNDDNASGTFTPKRYTVVLPDQQPKVYRSVLSHLEIPLPDHPMAYTAMPNADEQEEGIWAAGGINTANVAMTATETITSNPRVLAADPYVEYQPASGSHPEVPGGIGEEDIVTLVLPYIHTAREGVERLGQLLETYGTYEPNGIAFSDESDVWYMETIGGHHWIARKLPDDSYAVIANQFSIDTFDLEDACGRQLSCMASADLKEFIEKNHLNLSFNASFNARLAFGSDTATDHIYNTPRVWYGQRYFNPRAEQEEGFSPESSSLPWCRKPEFRITVEDIKTVLSSSYEGTPWDPYLHPGSQGKYRPIGINRTSCAHLMEIRSDVPEERKGVEWIAFGCNAYNTFIPQYTSVCSVPEYLSYTPEDVSTASCYWISRLISALADPCHEECVQILERYQLCCGSVSRHLLEQEPTADPALVNQQIADAIQKETDHLLQQVLYASSMRMTNRFSLSDF